jgi:putative ABC transport system substrate-binding protein
MHRRVFVAGLMIASAMRPTGAQQPAKTKRIALVAPVTKVGEMTEKNQNYRFFFEELNRLGFIEGQNLVVQRYSAEGRRERYAELAREVVNTHPDLIVTFSGVSSLALKAATKEIPIVAVTADPVAQGLVSSLAHHGENITGVSSDAGLQLYEKWVELLKELVPNLSSFYYVVSQPNWEKIQSSEAVREGAKRAGIVVRPVLLGSTFDEEAYARAFKSTEQDRADALLVSNEVENWIYRVTLLRLIAERRLPAMYPSRGWVELGGLMSYGAEFNSVFRRFVVIIADVLNGKKPQDIPFSQPTKFELVINLKTAKSQRIDVPDALIARADEVIE